MTPQLWTPGGDLPAGARADAYLRQERRRTRDRWRRVRDPRVERTLELAVTFRSPNGVTLTTGTGTQTSGSEPSGAANGDLLVALALCGAVISQPSGWTQRFKDTQGTVNWVVSDIPRGASSPSDLLWTWAGSAYFEIHIICLTGAATVTFDSVSAAGSKGNSAHDPNPPSTTSVKTTSLAVCGGINFGAISAWTAPAGYTVRTTNTGGIDGAMCTKSLSGAGPEDPAAITAGTPNGDWWDGFTLTYTDESGRRFLLGRH